MRCSKCGSDNPAGKKFCGDCGAPLDRCPKCGAENPPSKRFCGECGASLIATGPAIAEPRGDDLTGERRHLTVLFCDLVGSTGIAARLDPEEWREIVASYHRAATEAITQFGGYVAQYQGDGVMAYFGWPEAHDNNAERAARAGLAIIDGVAKLNEHTARPKLSARVGIDSGAVVVGAGVGSKADVFGDTPNIAARVQAVALPNTVLVTADTHRLISGLFVVEDAGAQALKGIERPLQLYQVIQPSRVRGRLEAVAAARGLTPFVGREDELRLLLNRWGRTLEGEGQAVLIIGEAGIGKSRLVQHFHQQMAQTPHTWAEAVAGPLFQNTPFYPVTQLLGQFLAASVDEPLDDQAARLEPALELAGLKPPEAIPLIAPLLNLPVPQKYHAPLLLPEQQRRRLLATLIEWVRGVASLQPLVIAVEDLHWADPSTLELLELLLEQGATARLLLLYTGRPEFRPQWPLRAHHAQINLNRLSARDVREMIAQVAARNALAGETVDTVIERTGGVPLFVEELTRSVLESGSAKLAGREIPATLHDSLMVRLDRLGPAKEIIQIGAVIGSEFSHELLQAVHPGGAEELQSALRIATDAELVYVRGIAPEATYQFKHSLIRDAAYEALLKSRRKELHRQVARVIDEKFPALKEAHPELLARHWTAADATEPAIVEWTRAGNAAESRSAFKEAQESYEQALTLLKLLPESRERDLRELKLQSAIYLTGYYLRALGAQETIDAVERAAALAQKSGNLSQLFDLTFQRWFVARISGDLRTASALADQALEVAHREGSAARLAVAQNAQFFTRHDLGDLVGAEKHFAAGLKFFDDPDSRQQFPLAVLAFAHASMNAWMLGRISVARQRDAQFMAIVNENNPLELAASKHLAAVIRVLLRDHVSAEMLAAEALALCEKISFAQGAATSRCILGYERTLLHGAPEGIELIRSGIAAMHEMGSQAGLGALTSLLAEALARQGPLPEALDTIEQALRLNPDELTFRPEILRIRGELRLALGRTEEAKADFQEAIALAVGMSAKSWELRATMSLARLRASEGLRDEARAMLSEIYNWFTEGFDTADLKEAKALLEELGGTEHGLRT